MEVTLYAIYDLKTKTFIYDVNFPEGTVPRLYPTVESAQRRIKSEKSWRKNAWYVRQHGAYDEVDWVIWSVLVLATDHVYNADGTPYRGRKNEEEESRNRRFE